MGDNVEIVYADSLAWVAIVDAPSLEGHDGIAFLSFLSSRGLTNLLFVRVTREGFVPIYLNLINDLLNMIMCSIKLLRLIHVKLLMTLISLISWATI